MAGHAECQVDRFKEAAIAEVENFYRRESRMPCLVIEKRFHDIAKLLCYLLFGRLRDWGFGPEPSVAAGFASEAPKEIDHVVIFSSGRKLNLFEHGESCKMRGNQESCVFFSFCWPEYVSLLEPSQRMTIRLFVPGPVGPTLPAIFSHSCSLIS